MRLDTARRFALSLPETTEEPHFDMSSLLRRAKLRRPSPFFWRSGRSFHFRNDELLEEAWLAKASKRVLAAYDASR